MNARDIMVLPPTIDKSSKISYALEIMEKKNTRRILVTNNKQAIGLLTMRNLTKELGTKNKLKPPSSLPVVSAITNDIQYVDPIVDISDVTKILLNFGGVVLVSRNNEDVMGWITPNEIISSCSFNGFAKDFMVKDNIITVNKSNTISHARYLMLENNIGRIPVIDNGILCGIISERDLAIAFQDFKDTVPTQYQESRIKEILIDSVMKKNLIVGSPETKMSEISSWIINKNIGIVPILDKNKLVGIITRRTLLNSALLNK